MNEKVKKLAEQAGIEFDDSFSSEPETIYYLKLSDFEKFAELIVQECCDIFVELRTRPADLAVKDVKKHFGVEE